MIEAAEGDDGFNRAFGDLAMLGHRHRGAVPAGECSSHDDVTAGLPVCRSRTKPCAARMRQISAGGSGRSLGMRQRQGPHSRAALQAPFDLGRARRFEPEPHGFGQHPVSLGPGLALARDPQFWTPRHEPAAIFFNDSREIRQVDHLTIAFDPVGFHAGNLAQTPTLASPGLAVSEVERVVPNPLAWRTGGSAELRNC